MGLFSDILEANRGRSYEGYVDPCMIMKSLCTNYKRFDDYRRELKNYNGSEIDIAKKAKIRQEFLQRSSELEKLKSDYLVAEKAILEINNRGKIQSVYMQDMLDTLQYQLQSAYGAICQLRSEIDQKFMFDKMLEFHPDSEDAIRSNILNKLISTTLHHMEEGLFADTSTFRKVVSDCAEIIRCMKNEEYRISDKLVFSSYLMKTVGLKPTQQKCCNCGKQLLNNTVYCLNCYERNL